MECKECKTDFTPKQVFCSASCRAKHFNRGGKTESKKFPSKKVEPLDALADRIERNSRILASVGIVPYVPPQVSVPEMKRVAKDTNKNGHKKGCTCNLCR